MLGTHTKNGITKPIEHDRLWEKATVEHEAESAAGETLAE